MEGKWEIEKGRFLVEVRWAKENNVGMEIYFGVGDNKDCSFF